VALDAVGLGHLGDLGLGVRPCLLGGVADQRGDPQPELQRGVLAFQLLAEQVEPFDPLADAVERLAPEQLDVGLGGGDLLRGFRGAAEVEPGVLALAVGDRTRYQRRIGYAEVLAVIGDCLLAPKPAHDLDELLGAGVAVRLVTFAFTVTGRPRR